MRMSLLILKAILTGIFLFISTNIDEFILGFLLITKPGMTKRDWFIGKYISIIVILALSSLGIFLLLIIPIEWIGILGFIPLFIGIKTLFSRKSKENEITENQIYIKNSYFSSNILIVASLNIASGGDNIGLYIPFFANSSFWEIVLIIIIFLILTYVWCIIPYKIINSPQVQEKIVNWGKKTFPWLMIVLGLYIFLDTGFLLLGQGVILVNGFTKNPPNS